MEKKDTFKTFLRSFLIWFLLFYAILWGYETFFEKEKNVVKELPKQGEILISPAQKSFVVGNLVSVKIENQSPSKITFTSPCEKEGTLEVLYTGKFEQVDLFKKIVQTCDPTQIPGFSLEPKQSRLFALQNQNTELFQEEGTYKFKMNFTYGESEETMIESQSIEVKSAGAFRSLFRAIISKPLFNLLAFLTNHIPGHKFGWSIIIMTILVRIVLFIPNQKAMRSQRELQKLQPKMDELKEKYGKNQQEFALKTMELYKMHKINPMGSCLPILLQMPIMLGLFYIIRDGLSPHLNYLLYAVNDKIDLSLVNVYFLGLNLDQKGTIILAILVGIVQWGALALAFMSVKKRNQKTEAIQPKKSPSESPMEQVQQVNKIMQWILPVMIAYFVLSVPAGVGLYWFVSTLLGMGQQYYVNWLLDQPQVVKKQS